VGKELWRVLLTHPVGCAATPVLTRLYGRETRPHRVAPRRGFFGRRAVFGGNKELKSLI
jgi:hypothetical protein